MKINDEKEKNDLFFQDVNVNNKSFIYKLFGYFSSMFQLKKEGNSFLLCGLMILEIIQFISYVFTPIHYDSWKIELKTLKMISNITGAFRLSPLLQYINYQIYCSILYLFVALIFIFCLIVILQILFGDSSSKLFRFSTKIIQPMIDIISIVLYIPITEILLMPIKCIDGKVDGIKDGETCWESTYYLNLSLGIIATILLFIWCIFMINFNFFPFQKNMSNMRINSNNDIIIIIMKLFIILQNFLITNRDLSIAILLLTSITMFYNCFVESTYNNKHLELFITLKHLTIIWTYFVLLISKTFINFNINGFIFLLLFGYPIIIYLSILISNDKHSKFTYLSENSLNLNDFIQKVKFNIELVDNFIESNNNLRSGNESETQRKIILLQGNIKIHNESCDDKDCPLTKFAHNEGNFNIQKQCLLNYMNIFFNKGIKKYPKSIYLLILYIQFNYSKKYNLNSVKTNMLQLKKMKCTIKEMFIFFCMEQNMKNNSGINININNEQDNDNQLDVIGQKYQKLKYLIENSIKLYAEFWGIFSINITNNINTNKLYSLGEKLNRYLNEINSLWENNLKNRRINNDYQSIVQLYSKFLLEILLDKNKSKEVYKKLNDESLNNYYQKDEKTKNNNGAEKIDQLVDNQDYLLFCDSDEKGNSKIIQCSSSFSNFLGYQKYSIIGKSVEIIYPNFFMEHIIKYLEESIKLLHAENNQKNLTIQDSNVNKESKLIMVKNRIGYVIPLMASFVVSDDNDYSDSFLIKSKMEYKESRSEYSYYILTNSDCIIENISSSALNLGLSLDLIRKYDMKIDILLKNEKNKSLNIYEKYSEYEDEPKVITWIFPDLIYPKDDSKNNENREKNEDIETLVGKSNKKKFNLLIRTIKFDENEVTGFVFKFTEISLKKKKKYLKIESFIPDTKKNIFLFDLLSLNYIRTIIVEEKTGLRNLRDFEDNIDNDEIENTGRSNKTKKIDKVKKKIIYEEKDSSTDSDKNANKNLLTKDKILELQVHDFLEIKNFIFTLPIYGQDVSLEKFRPNGEKYSASKISEALIKIKVSTFCKTLEEKYHLEQNFKKKKNKSLNPNKYLDSPKPNNTDNHLLSSKSIPSLPDSSISSVHGEEMNKNLSSDSSSTLSNIFKADSIKYIAILVFFIFIETILFVSIEFILINNNINKVKHKIEFLYKGYIILNDMLYTKYFVTEGVIGNKLNTNYSPVNGAGSLEKFLLKLKEELAFYRQEFTETYDTFTSNELCKDFNDYINETHIKIYSITINKTEKIPLDLSFNSAMSRIPSSINDIVADPSIMIMENRDTYELMYGLLNDYYIKWEKVILILLNDSEKQTKSITLLMVVVLCFFGVSVIIFIIFLKLLSKLTVDREKPINLFFTMKKVVFEKLKNSAEGFSNKLLNKFFGNEDNEEESVIDYQTNIHPNDINIVKLKAINEFDSSIKNAFSFIEIVLVIFLFLFVFILCSIIKFFNFKNRMNSIFQFISLFNKTNVDQTNLLLSIDIFKSFLYNKFIPVLNKENTQEEFIESFMGLSENLEDLIIYSSKTNSFLKGGFLDKFELYIYDNISELLDNAFVERNKAGLKNTFGKGLKSCKTRLFENIRYIAIKYCNSSEIYDNSYNISKILTEPDKLYHEMNMGVQYVIKYWYKNVIKLMINNFYDFKNKSSIFYIVFFICLIIIDILFYSIIWRTYEEKLKLLLKDSIDLINLIPIEIKNIIIEKLNE